jgi:hypothetical protein
MNSQEYITKIFRTKPEIIQKMEEKMNAITEKSEVLDKIIKENEHRISRTLSFLNCRDYSAENISLALITKLQKDDRAVYDLFKKPNGTSPESHQTLFNFAFELANIDRLFVLKKSVAENLLQKNPPQNTTQALGYKDVNELLEKENIYEIFATLRFMESNEWMHKFFDEDYKNLVPEDFEERKAQLIVLPELLKIAEKFVKKKYHNVSHLKELGVLFIIPLKIETPGETLRVFSMVLHYLHELEFYSRLFRKATLNENFSQRLISLLKGENPEINVFESDGSKWLIIQQYLAKDNPNDPRLFVPHLNPEALHWKKAEQDISNLGKRFSNIDLELWLDLDWVGGFFKNKNDQEELISFDLIDNWMALVNKDQQFKYLYHHQEALWNQIFEEYLGPDSVEKYLLDNFDKGFIEL